MSLSVGHLGERPEEQADLHRDPRRSRDQHGSGEIPGGQETLSLTVLGCLLSLSVISDLLSVVPQACENGRGAILLSVARGKVSRGNRLW